MSDFIDKNRALLLILLLIALGAVIRLLMPVPNFSPVMAMALFAGVVLTNRKLAFGYIVSLMLITDLIIGLHSTMPFVYGALLLVILIATKVNINSNLSILGSTLTSSFLFFLITNFGVWLVGGLYPRTLAGLELCFIAAIPYFRLSLIGDLFFVGLLFGLYRLANIYGLKQEAIISRLK